MKLTALRESQILAEMAAKKACPVCGHGMANFHFYRNGGWYCKTTSLKSPAPGANVAACQQALAAGAAPRVSGGTAPAATPAKSPAKPAANPAAPTPSAAASQPAQANAAPQPASQSAPAPVKALEGIQQKIDNWLISNEIENCTINDDNTVSVAGDLHLLDIRHTQLPVTFSHVDGDIHVSGGLLQNLKGLPKAIKGELSINNAPDITLVGAPQSLGSLTISDVKLSTLKHGGFKEITDNVQLTKMQLSDLEGLPEQIGGNFTYHGRINSLKGCPTSVGGYFKLDTSGTQKPMDLSYLPKTLGKAMILEIGDFRAEATRAPDFSHYTSGPIVITGSFSNPIKLPDVVNGKLVLTTKSSDQVLTVANLPSEINGDFRISASAIADIQKIHQQIKRVTGNITIDHCAEGTIDYQGSTSVYKISKMLLGPVLGLTQIKGVKSITFISSIGQSGKNQGELTLLQNTIDRVISGDIDVFEAQEILIDAGLTKQARL